MKPELQFLPPRQAVIYAGTRRMLDETALCVRKFAMRVAELYFEQTAIDQRHVKFRWGVTVDELCKAEKHNAQVLGRYMDGTVKVLPADLEDAWLRALPAPYLHELERELAARRGFLAVAMPQAVAGADLVNVSHLAKEFSELVAAIAPSLADGVVNAADLPHLHRILAEGDDLIGAVLAFQLRARAALPAQQPGRRRHLAVAR